jgi:NAD-dependent SIR2 family protein deacetylase
MRKKPYTEIGISRMKCIRCGRQAKYQWQICADDNIYRPLCEKCDIELNDMVLKWAGFEDSEEKMKKYRTLVLGNTET